MKNNIKIPMWTILILLSTVHISVFFANNEEVIKLADMTKEKPKESREIRDLRSKLQNMRFMEDQKHDWTTSNNENEQLRKEPAAKTQPVKFEPRTLTQHVTDFFSKLFGKGRKIDNAFDNYNKRLTDSIQKHNEAYSNKQISDEDFSKIHVFDKQEDKDAFTSMDATQQIEALNRFVKIEKEKFKKANEDQEKDNNQEQHNTDKRIELLKKQINHIEDQNKDEMSLIAKIITKLTFNDNIFTPEEITTLKSLNENSPNTAQTRDLIQKVLNETATNVLASKNILSTHAHKNLTLCLKKLTKNENEIENLNDSINKTADAVVADSLDRRITLQKAFNERIERLKNDIQALQPEDRQLKYNTDTDQFEYHSSKKAGTVADNAFDIVAKNDNEIASNPNRLNNDNEVESNPKPLSSVLNPTAQTLSNSGTSDTDRKNEWTPPTQSESTTATSRLSITEFAPVDKIEKVRALFQKLNETSNSNEKDEIETAIANIPLLKKEEDKLTLQERMIYGHAQVMNA